MKRDFTLHPAALALGLGAALALALPGGTQTRVTAGVRGKVVDEKGAGISDVKVVTGEVEGRVMGVRAKLADIKGVTVQTGDVKPGGDVTGVELG